MSKAQEDLMAKKGYITAAEAARRIGVTVSRIYEWLDENKLEGCCIGTGERPRRYVSSASLIACVGPEAAKALGLV